MAEDDPSEQRGGTTPDEAEAREKGEWAGTAAEGVVPAELGGSDAPREMLDEDPELGSSVLGRTTGSDEPATEAGIDLSAGDDADATTDGGAEPPRRRGARPEGRRRAAARRSASDAGSGSCTSVTATLTVRQRPQRTRTFLVICSASIASASTLPHFTHT